MKWAIELSKFDIKYKPKTAIKGQVLVDFFMEFTSAKPAENAQMPTDLLIWRLSIDRAKNAQGSGAGLILTSPEGIDIEYALRFRFQASNNEVEYEAVIAGLNLAHSMEVDQLEVCNNSKLVVRQIEDTYEAKSEKMILYLKKVRDLLKKFVLVQTHTQSEELPSRCLGKISDSLTRRPQQTNACQIPCRTFYRSLWRGSFPNRVRTVLDGPHLGLLNRRTSTR